MPPPTFGIASTTWPRDSSAGLSTSRLKPFSNSRVGPMSQMRGASNAVCSGIPWSMTFTIAWATAPKILSPPGTPSVIKGAPSLRTITGDMDDNTRLFGAIEFVRPGTGSMSSMQSLSNIPVPGTVTFEPKTMCNVFVVATTLPHSSMAQQ